MSIEIREFEPEDVLPLTAVHNQLFPADPRTPQTWTDLNHDYIWVMLRDGELVGYTAVQSIPGLPGLGEMEGFIAPKWQRQGLGSKLLQYIQAELTGTDIRQLSYPVPSLNTPAARFLQKNNYFIEHEEWTMTLNPITHYQLPINNYQLTIDQLLRRRTIPLFCRLYEASFRGAPWHQPFSAAEVADLLDEDNPIYFLVEGSTPVGFIWTRPLSTTAVMLEPIGIIETKQGRGYGRFFLQILINQLAAEGIETVQIGVWSNNKPALHLYQSLGFRKTDTLIYLAYDL